MTHNIPLLQIVHISDAHFRSAETEATEHKSIRSKFGAAIRSIFHGTRLWDEGTLGHSANARIAFQAALEDIAQDTAWIGDNGEGGAETWLVDTGDATTFGDRSSLNLYFEDLSKWRSILGGCKARYLFGNHDLWPGCQPILPPIKDYVADVAAASVSLAAKFNSSEWVHPLETPSVDGRPKIVCYALDTVSTGRWDAVLAAGRVSQGKLNLLESRVVASCASPTYRILATHHPISFPFTASRLGARLDPSMALRDSRAVASFLSKDRGASHLQPLIHLFLSGHTHAAMPGSPLEENCGENRQDALLAQQLQLVSGALMQMKAKSAPTSLQEQYTSAFRTHRNKQYRSQKLFTHPQQFQLLRFYRKEGDCSHLLLERLVFARVLGGSYAVEKSLTSQTLLTTSAAP